MASISEPRSGNINYDEPPRRSAPLLSVGPLAWIRQNLFRSAFDTILTFIFFGLVIGGITSLLRWAIVDANWFVITRNLRLFMLGSFEPATQWRVDIAALITAGVIGFTIAAWTRVNRLAGIILILLVIVIIAVPPITYAVTPPARSYFTAGNAPVASGTVTVTPLPAISFVGRGGETITVQVATTAGSDDTALTSIAGFTDRATEAVINGARNRLASEARIAEIEGMLADPQGLTTTQQTRLQDELTTLQEQRSTIPITETYLLNQPPVNIQLLRGDTMEVIAETTLTGNDAAWVFQLPVDGWYVLNKTTDSAEGVTLLQTTGIYPIIERSITVPLAGGGTALDSEYARITDELSVAADIPEVDEAPVPFVVIIDHQYKGARPFSDWMRLHVAPFLSWSGRLILPLMAVAAIGFFAARTLNRMPANPGAQSWSSVYPMSEARGFALSQNKAAFIATRLWILLPFVAWSLIYGLVFFLPVTNYERWGGLLLTIVLASFGIVVSFPLGVMLALGRRSSLPVIKWVSTTYIEVVRGVPLITVLFMAQLLVPLVNPSLSEFPNVFRAMIGITLFSAAYLAENVRGGLQAIPPGQEEAAKALGLNPLQVTLFITLPQALRLVIPALVGQFISLFKDTSLVAIVGLIDLTGVGRNVIGQTEFNGLQTETFVFLAMVYFVFCYTMGVISRRIESSGSGSARRI